MRIFSLLGIITLLELLSSAAQASGSGQNFGSNPAVTLDSLAFTTQPSSSTPIVANGAVGPTGPAGP
jgi:hypothetical protein